MDFVLVVAAGLALVVVVAFAIVFRKLLSPARQSGVDQLEWSREFSIAKYRPMERLFLREDLEFLSSQPGYTPRVAHKLRADRRRVFRQYLRCLTRDFDRLYAAAKFLLLHCAEDRPDLAFMLLKQRLVFRYAVASVHVSLTLQAFGLGTVDVRPLVAAVESMGDRVRDLTAEVAAV